MPVHDDSEDVLHGVRAERLDGDDVEVTQEARRDVVPPSAGGAHGSDDQLVDQGQRTRVFPAEMVSLYFIVQATGPEHVIQFD